MARTVYDGTYFAVSHTEETAGAHVPGEEHYEDTAALTILIRGSGSCCIEGHFYELGPGDIVTMGLNEIHSFRFSETGCHERLSVYFTAAVLSPFWAYELPLMQIFTCHAPGQCNRYPASEYDAQEAKSVIAGIARMADSLTDASPSVEKAKLHLLVLRLLFLLFDCFGKRRKAGPFADNDSTIARICRYIHENPGADLSYDGIQKQFRVSRYYLSVRFRQNTGLTLTRYVLQKRLMHVSAWVHEGNGIVAAADLAGFQSYSHFYKEFVRVKGVSPKIYYRKTSDKA